MSTTTKTPDTATYSFETSSAAWAFMRSCDDSGISAGFPSLDGRNTVKVSIRTWQEREQVDALNCRDLAENSGAA